MILLIDNYDSFSYNLYQLIGSINPDIRVVRNDELTIPEIESLVPQAIILSPGPGRPSDAGIIVPVARHFAGKVPILGVCLGHQAICEAFGATVSYAKQLMHGKPSPITVDTRCLLFRGLPETIQAVRYHSLAGAGKDDSRRVDRLCANGGRRSIEAQWNRRGTHWRIVYDQSEQTGSDGKVKRPGIRNRPLDTLKPWKTHSIDDIRRLTADGIVQIVQLHGQEDASYIADLKSVCSAPIIKAIRVECLEDIAAADRWPTDFVLFDNGLGGTGRSFDWSLLAAAACPFFLAGGVSAQNVPLALKKQPFALDVSSAVETEGVKDRNKILEFFARVRLAEDCPGN